MVLTWLAEGDALAGGTKASNIPAPATPQGPHLPTFSPSPGNLSNNGEYFNHLRSKLVHWRAISSSPYLHFLERGVMPFFKAPP